VFWVDTSLTPTAADTVQEFKLQRRMPIYATARQHNATLVTSDAHFANLPYVKYFQK
jgi:predicted nuclease of predicted toxin-antitoxin system